MQVSGYIYGYIHPSPLFIRERVMCGFNFISFIYHISPSMERLEERLDREVEDYVSRVEGTREISDLLAGDISRADYIRLLKTCYVLESISRSAVLRASERTEGINPYLSERFKYCARGEEGHAEIALEDLKGLGVAGVDMSDIPLAEDYDSMLRDAAEGFPLGILGHSYLFENASGIMFPKHRGHEYPSKFIEVHAREDPGHARAIKRTVRHIEPGLSEGEREDITRFARESGEFLLRLFQNIQG